VLVDTGVHEYLQLRFFVAPQAIIFLLQRPPHCFPRRVPEVLRDVQCAEAPISLLFLTLFSCSPGSHMAWVCSVVFLVPIRVSLPLPGASASGDFLL
jgi:hypothetical protein